VKSKLDNPIYGKLEEEVTVAHNGSYTDLTIKVTITEDGNGYEATALLHRGAVEELIRKLQATLKEFK